MRNEEKAERGRGMSVAPLCFGLLVQGANKTKQKKQPEGCRIISFKSVTEKKPFRRKGII